MKKPTKRRRSKKRRPDFFQKNRFLLVLLGVIGLALISLILLARMAEQPLAPVVPPTQKPTYDYTKTVFIEVEAFLSALDIDAGDIQRDLDPEPGVGEEVQLTMAQRFAESLVQNHRQHLFLKRVRDVTPGQSDDLHCNGANEIWNGQHAMVR